VGCLGEVVLDRLEDLFGVTLAVVGVFTALSGGISSAITTVTGRI
jgi:hypothetical protein